MTKASSPAVTRPSKTSDKFDGAATSIRLVVNPERMVIAEARRTYTYLSLFGYRVDAVVANRLLPDEVQDPWFARWKEIQATHLAEIDESFAPLPVLRSLWADDEPVGLERLRAFAGALYADHDAVAVLHTGEPFRITKENDRYVVHLDLPFIDSDQVDLTRRADELLISVGPYRRSILLPASLRRRTVAAAKLSDGVLRVTFADPVGGSGPRPAASPRRRAASSVSARGDAEVTHIPEHRPGASGER